MLTYLALTLGIIGLVMAWRANRKNSQLNERISQSNSRIYSLRRELQEAIAQAEQERLGLKIELLKLQGELRITPETKIGEVMAVHPQAQQVLASFHLGGCSSCYVDDQQSLADAAAVNGRELEPILAALNILVDQSGQPGNGTVSPDQLKVPNIQLQL
jgi:hybrid cluster-associated redox disulfide protein